MIRRRDLRRISRGLRFRLTASYALFFTVLLIGASFLFGIRLTNTLQKEAHDALTDHWDAMKGYLRIEKKHEIDPDERALWYYDENDTEETTIVLDIKKIYIVAAADGKVILDEDDNPAYSEAYKEIFDPPANIRKPNPIRQPRIPDRFGIRGGIPMGTSSWSDPASFGMKRIAILTMSRSGRRWRNMPKSRAASPGSSSA